MNILTHDEILRGILGKKYDDVMKLYKAIPKEVIEMITKHKKHLEECHNSGLHMLMIIEIIENETGNGYDSKIQKAMEENLNG